MTWIAINSPQLNAGSASTEPGPPVSTKADKSSASKFRVNVLAASESIVSTRPKRTKTSKRDDPPICNIGKGIQKPQKPSDRKRKELTQHFSPSNLSTEEQPQFEPISKKLRIEQPNLIISIPASRVDNARQNYQSPIDRWASELKQTDANNLLDSCDFFEDESKSLASSPRTLKEEFDPGLESDSHVEENQGTLSDEQSPIFHLSDGSTLTTPIVIESSDSDCDDFSNFDDSVFDQLRLPVLSDLVSSKPKSLNTRPLFAYGFTKDLPAQVIDEQPQQRIQPAHPNDAPFPPFMHPNVDYAMHTICTEDRLPSSASDGKVLTCFRVAEALRVIAAFRSDCWNAGKEIRLALFAAIHETKHANSLGEGQGLVFSDVFFTDKRANPQDWSNCFNSLTIIIIDDKTRAIKSDFSRVRGSRCQA